MTMTTTAKHPTCADCGGRLVRTTWSHELVHADVEDWADDPHEPEPVDDDEAAA